MPFDLFGDPTPEPASPAARAAKARSGPGVIRPVAADDGLLALAQNMPSRLRMGTSTWSYPGWQGLVWEGEHTPAELSKRGLPAYGKQPLLRAVCIDRSFYRPLTASQYAHYAGQVNDDFRFVVKAPSVVTDALVRSEDGRGRQANPAFLNAELAIQEFVLPALEGLGHKLGALVFQLSPLPMGMLVQLDQVLERLHTLLRALPALSPLAPDAVMAVEVRDPDFLRPDFVDLLKDTGATYCLGLHAKMPRLQEQLPILRALWPGPLVCRWNLNPIYGPYGYEDAQKKHEPFDQLTAPDVATRELLARTIAGITGAGQNAYVTISNDAEGCAPRSVRALAEAIAALQAATGK